nr:hypothetical protein [Tanacetum cinerariifolium]
PFVTVSNLFFLYAEMDLSTFIHHVDPTKVQIREREVIEGEVLLLELTKGRVVQLFGVNPGNQNEVVEEAGTQNEGGVADGQEIPVDTGIIRVEDKVPNAIVKKPKVYKRMRGADGASSSNHLPKKLRANHGTFGDVGASTGGKSLVATQELFEQSTLNVEVGVTATTTMPFVTSSVTPTSEREEGDRTDSVIGPTIRTQRTTERFVVLSDSSHHSSTNAVDDEVTSIVKSLVSNPTILTTVIATTVVADTSALVPKAGPELVHHTLFADTELSTNSFYVVIDHLAPPMLFSQLRSMDYDQLFVEFNVGAARQTCLSSKVRLRLENELRGRKMFEGKCVMQAGWLKEKDAKIAEMDLSTFIHHVDPTKVQIREREVIEGEVLLLELTKGRVVQLFGVNPGNQNEVVEEAGTQNEGGVADGQEIPVDTDVGASTGGKSLVATQELFEQSTLNVEVGVTATTTMPFVTSSVTPTSERDEGDRTDSVIGPTIRTQRTTE